MEPGRPRERAEVPAVDLDVSWLVPADLGAVDALARLQVTASRCGRSLQLHGACGGLPELLEFLGLVGVLQLCRCCDPSAGEPWASRDG
jgi:ABC-type transporter Mla MlaB component